MKDSISCFFSYFCSDVFSVKAKKKSNKPMKINMKINYMWNRTGETQAVYVYFCLWLAFSTYWLGGGHFYQILTQCNLTSLKPQTPLWLTCTALFSWNYFLVFFHQIMLLFLFFLILFYFILFHRTTFLEWKNHILKMGGGKALMIPNCWQLHF